MAPREAGPEESASPLFAEGLEKGMQVGGAGPAPCVGGAWRGGPAIGQLLRTRRGGGKEKCRWECRGWRRL